MYARARARVLRVCACALAWMNTDWFRSVCLGNGRHPLVAMRTIFEHIQICLSSRLTAKTAGGGRFSRPMNQTTLPTDGTQIYNLYGVLPNVGAGARDFAHLRARSTASELMPLI